MAEINGRTEVTRLLQAGTAGDAPAFDRVLGVLYDDLRRQARRYMRSQPRNHTLEAEGLLHEAWIKVSNGTPVQWESRGHFLAVMSVAMRHTLIDHSDRKRSQRRGGRVQRVPLTGILLPFEDTVVDLVTIHDALEALRREHPDAARVIELRFFLGLTTEDVAEALGCGTRTVERLWEFARTKLRSLLGE